MVNLLTVNEVGKLLGITPRAVYQMCYRGKLPFVKLGAFRSSRIRFKQEDIEAYIAECSVSAFNGGKNV